MSDNTKIPILMDGDAFLLVLRTGVGFKKGATA